MFQMPQGANFVAGRSGRSEIFRPIGYANDDLNLQMGDFNYWVIARLKPGVGIAQANAELNVIQEIGRAHV